MLKFKALFNLKRPRNLLSLVSSRACNEALALEKVIFVFVEVR